MMHIRRKKKEKKKNRKKRNKKFERKVKLHLHHCLILISFALMIPNLHILVLNFFFLLQQVYQVLIHSFEVVYFYPNSF